MERYWKKFMVNVGLNQICTIENKTFKEIKKDPQLVERMKKLIWEVKLLAEKEGIKNSQSLYDDTMNFLINEFEDATPSMLQDIRAGRKTEVDIFAGEIICLGLIHNIQTPENEKIYKEIKAIEDIKIV
jgi:2-dehydropantoate 2-reductase